MCGYDQEGSQLHQGHIKPLTKIVVVRVDDDSADAQKFLFLVEVYFPDLDPVYSWVGVLTVGGQTLGGSGQLVRVVYCLHSTPSRCSPVVSHLWMQ